MDIGIKSWYEYTCLTSLIPEENKGFFPPFEINDKYLNIRKRRV